MALSALVGAWLAGALGGGHCLAMCGGFVALMAAGGASAEPRVTALLPARTLAWRQLAYNAGRITTYALRHVDLIVPSSVIAARHIRDRFGLSEQQVQAVPWGVDLQQFSPADAQNNI